MDDLSKELQDFLVKLSYHPETVESEHKHFTKHIVLLLPAKEKDTLLRYFGLFGYEREALINLACEQNTTEEALMEQIDGSLRKLAITPEWQMMKGWV